MLIKSSLGSTGKKTSFNIYLLAIISAVLLISTTACGQSVAMPTATVAPTATPLPSPTAAATLQSGETQHTVKVDGADRTYLLHIPAGLASNKPAPVVFALHGFDNEHYFEVSDLKNMAGFDAISDQSRFILIYPEGVSGFWNVGGGCCVTSAQNNVDEAAYIRQVLIDLSSIASVDPKRIYATGFSMGGMFAFKLACEMSDTFAAVAPVAGALLDTPCSPSQPVSIMQVNGKNDTLVPYGGGVGNFMTGNINFPPVEQGIATWVQLDGCTGTAKSEKQGTVGTLTAYTTCKAGSAVDLYTLDALGNNWPSQYVLPVSQMIWDFFKAHPKP
jgi:polyhydroxybutyrate depolymerase